MADDSTQGGTQADPAQQPQAGTPHANPLAGDATSTSTDRAETLSLEEAKKLRQEHKALRERLKGYEDEQKKRDDAELTTQQKADKKLAELQRQHSEYQTAAQQRIVRAEVKAAASGVGLDPGLAAKLIDYAEIEFDDDGEPKNIEKLLAALVKQYPQLVAECGGQRRYDADQQRDAHANQPGAQRTGDWWQDSGHER